MSQGLGSVIDLSALTTFVDNSFIDASELQVLKGGAVTAPKLDRLIGVKLVIEGSSTLPTVQLKQAVRSTLIAQGAAVDLSGVTTLTDSRVELNSGGTVNLENASNVDGASFVVNTGVRLSLPAVTRCDLPEAQNSYALWKADGPGSVLEFPNLPMVTGSSGYNAYLDIQAVNGGVINLAKVTQLNDPPPGEAPGNYDRENGIRVLSQGLGSVIDLSALTVFADNSQVPNSTLTTRTLGAVLVPSAVSLRGINQTVEPGSLVPPGDFDSDGLANLQEYWAGTNPQLADTDGDGQSDLNEIMAGTDPNRSGSKPDLALEIYHAIEIQTVTRPGVAYQLQSSADLVNWLISAAPFTGDGKTAHWFSSLEAGEKQFFRLKKL